MLVTAQLQSQHKAQMQPCSQRRWTWMASSKQNRPSRLQPSASRYLAFVI